MRGVCGGRGGVSLPDELDLDGALVLRGEAAGGRCGRGLRRRRRFFFFFFFSGNSHAPGTFLGAPSPVLQRMDT